MKKDNNREEFSKKEEMARAIAGNLSSKEDDDLYYREEVRRRTGVRPVNAQSRSAEEDLYMRESMAQDYKRLKKAEQKRKKRRRRNRIILVIVFIILLLAAAAAAAAWMWFSNGKKQYEGVFLENTYINGTNVGRNTPEQAAELIIQDSDMPDVITLTLPDGEDVVIPLEDVGLSNNVAETVESFYKQQNHNEWYSAQASRADYNFVISYDFDRDQLDDEVKRKVIEGESGTEPQNAYIKRTSSGFEVVAGKLGTTIDEDKAQTLYDYIDGFLDRGVYAIDLSDCDCYEQPEVRAADLKEEAEKLNALFDMEITFDFTYTTETLKGETIMDWITFNDDDPTQGYTVDEDMAMTYVEDLADKYDTYNKDRKFKTTNKGTITLEQGSGDYGWWIDQEKTCALIVDLIEEGASATTEPIYYTNPSSQYTYTCNPDARTAKGDIGSTYIEIDLEAQHFWYYKKGKLTYECDIVSGKPTAARNTPAGVYKLWYKELNKTLTGTNEEGDSWSTPVTYWNNVSTFGVGLHDATWHTYFGGDRYINYGSHGCINMPLEAAKYVYENIELNTPVIMYW